MKTFFLIIQLLFSSVCWGVFVDPVVSAGYETGGDTLVDLVFTDGSRSKIKAGQGFLINAGLNTGFEISETDFISLQTTLGYKFASTKQATNGSLDWTHVLLDALVFYNKMDPNQKYGFRLGAGLSANLRNKLKGGEGITDGISLKADNQVGLVIQGDFVFGDLKQYMIGARATFIDYKLESYTKVSGNSVGLQFTYFFKTIPLISKKEPNEPAKAL